MKAFITSLVMKALVMKLCSCQDEQYLVDCILIQVPAEEEITNNWSIKN